jgi:hypothetical protein
VDALRRAGAGNSVSCRITGRARPSLLGADRYAAAATMLIGCDQLHCVQVRSTFAVMCAGDADDFGDRVLSRIWALGSSVAMGYLRYAPISVKHFPRDVGVMPESPPRVLIRQPGRRRASSRASRQPANAIEARVGRANGIVVEQRQLGRQARPRRVRLAMVRRRRLLAAVVARPRRTRQRCAGATFSQRELSRPRAEISDAIWRRVTRVSMPHEFSSSCGVRP